MWVKAAQRHFLTVGTFCRTHRTHSPPIYTHSLGPNLDLYFPAYPGHDRIGTSVIIFRIVSSDPSESPYCLGVQFLGLPLKPAVAVGAIPTLSAPFHKLMDKSQAANVEA